MKAAIEIGPVVYIRKELANQHSNHKQYSRSSMGKTNIDCIRDSLCQGSRPFPLRSRLQRGQTPPAVWHRQPRGSTGIRQSVYYPRGTIAHLSAMRGAVSTNCDLEESIQDLKYPRRTSMLPKRSCLCKLRRRRF